jgi:hypothetical protein
MKKFFKFFALLFKSKVIYLHKEDKVIIIIKTDYAICRDYLDGMEINFRNFLDIKDVAILQVESVGDFDMKIIRHKEKTQ